MKRLLGQAVCHRYHSVILRCKKLSESLFPYRTGKEKTGELIPILPAFEACPTNIRSSPFSSCFLAYCVSDEMSSNRFPVCPYPGI